MDLMDQPIFVKTLKLIEKKKIFKKEEKSVSDYKNGNKNALGFLVGQVMKETKGKANPAIVNDILKKRLDK